ncbi:MAG: DUF4250 domain-containing protein [Holdemanella sp.]|nr:DUF4250 domain-containing protein [Holdemanella sp.]
MLPKDPFMLLSYVNTQLRDNYPSLDELCSSLDEDKEEILNKLNKAGYAYDEDGNRFIPK